MRKIPEAKKVATLLSKESKFEDASEAVSSAVNSEVFKLLLAGIQVKTSSAFSSEKIENTAYFTHEEIESIVTLADTLGSNMVSRAISNNRTNIKMVKEAEERLVEAIEAAVGNAPLFPSLDEKQKKQATKQINAAITRTIKDIVSAEMGPSRSH